MIRRLVLVSLIAVAIAAEPQAQQPQVIGSWKLVSYVTETPDGKRTFPLGEKVDGLAVYLPNGRVTIQFMRSDPPRFQGTDAWRGTLQEERVAFRGFFGYAGRYTLDVKNSTVTHHVEICSVPNYIGTDLVRMFSFSGSRLTLRSPERQLSGQKSS